jgi:hypothetical protein
VSDPANPPPEVVSGRRAADPPLPPSPDPPGAPPLPPSPDPPGAPPAHPPAAPPSPPEPDPPAGRLADPRSLPEPEPPIPLRPPHPRPAPEPLEADTVRIMLIGTALWFAGFLVLLPFRGRLADDGHEVWLWTCLAGGLLGLLGLVLATRARAAARARQPPGAADDHVRR